MPTPRIRYELTAEDKSGPVFDRIRGSIDGVSAKFAALSAATAIGGLVALTATVARAADDLSDFAGGVGISTEALSQLRSSAAAFGVEAGTLDTAIVRMQSAIAKGSESFAKLGIDLEAIRRLQPDRQFEIIAEAISRVDTAADRTARTVDIFGRGAAKLTAVVAGGAAGVREMRQRVDELGATLTQEGAAKLGAAADALDRFQVALQGGARIIAEAFAPAVTAVVSLLTEAIPAAARIAAASMEQLKATLTRGAAAIVEFFDTAGGGGRGRGAQGGRRSAAAEALREQASDYEVAVAEIIDELQGLGEQLERSTDDAGRYITGGIQPLGSETDKVTEATRRLKKEQSEIAALFEATRTAAEREAAEIARLTELYNRGAISFETFARAQLQAELTAAESEEAAERQTVAGRRREAQQRAAAAAYEATRTPQERLLARETELNELYASRAIDFDTYARAQLQAEIAAEEAIERKGAAVAKTGDESIKLLKQIQGELDNFARDVTDAFFEAGSSISDLFEDLAVSVAKLVFNKSVAQPISDGISGLIDDILGGLTSGGSGGSGGLGSFFSGIGSSIGSFFGFAKGGPVTGPTLVGESGPELIDRAGNVIPLSGVAASDGAGAVPAVNITFNVNSLDPRTAAAVIVQNRDVITGIVRGAFARTGTAAAVA